MLQKKLFRIIAVILFIQLPALARDILFEVKTGYFYPTNQLFRCIYGGGAFVEPELTVQLSCNEHWYAFLSAEYFGKNGYSLGLCNQTKVQMVPLGIGLKYFFPFCYGDAYVGLGFQPTYFKTMNCSSFVQQCTSQWAFGGVAKAGTYFDLPHNFFIDLFVDYSFVKAPCNSCCVSSSTPIFPLKANLSNALFGAGIGYRF